MTLIFCADDRGGLLFNGRRQSRDRAVRADILRITAGQRLYMDGYSRRQFTEPESVRILPGEEPGETADGAWFLERQDIPAALPRAGRLIVYRWNRVYPADRRLTLPPPGWRLDSRTDFAGSSHETITREVYVR